MHVYLSGVGLTLWEGVTNESDGRFVGRMEYAEVHTQLQTGGFSFRI